MKEFKSPKIVIYENVDKAVSILERYMDDDVEEVAKEILDAFKIPYGKRTEIGLFQDDVYMLISQDKKTTIKVREEKK